MINSCYNSNQWKLFLLSFEIQDLNCIIWIIMKLEPLKYSFDDIRKIETNSRYQIFIMTMIRLNCLLWHYNFTTDCMLNEVSSYNIVFCLNVVCTTLFIYIKHNSSDSISLWLHHLVYKKKYEVPTLETNEHT